MRTTPWISPLLPGKKSVTNGATKQGSRPIQNNSSSCSVSVCTRVGVSRRDASPTRTERWRHRRARRKRFSPLGAGHERRGEAGLQPDPRRARCAGRCGRAGQRRHVDRGEPASRATEPPPQESPGAPHAAAEPDDQELPAPAGQPTPPHPASRLDVAWRASHPLSSVSVSHALAPALLLCLSSASSVVALESPDIGPSLDLDTSKTKSIYRHGATKICMSQQFSSVFKFILFFIHVE
jgi:hypothetical protein